MEAFGDTMDAGAGDDSLVGDVAHAGDGNVYLTAKAGTAGDVRPDDDEYPNLGGDGGNDNTVVVFSDKINAGTGNDTIVGDVHHTGTSGAIDLSVLAGVEGERNVYIDPDDGSVVEGNAASGGTGNEASAFNDTIDSGGGNDVIIGDVWRADAGVTLEISVGGTVENIIRAFQDDISAGDGDDTIHGDFFDGTAELAPDTLTIDGDFAGRDALFADTIDGGGGNDVIHGGLGDDILSGGTGEDSFNGGDGLDTVDYSYSSSDRLRVDLSEGFAWFVDDPTNPAGSGNEASTIEALTAIENVIGTTGDNVLIGDANDNVFSGLGGTDAFDGGGGTDTVDYSYSSSDRLRVDLSEGFAWFVDDPTSPVGPGNEASTVEALTSIENVIGTTGDNVIIGDANDNVLIGLGGQDTFDGGDGTDTVDYSYSSSNTLEIDLAAGLATFLSSGVTEILTNIENAIGSDGNTVLRGDDGDNMLDGGDGDDTVDGRGGDDTLIGGNGDDTLSAGSGDDTLIGDRGDDTLSGGIGTDSFDGGDGSDTVDYSYSSSDRLRVDLSEGFAWFVDDPTSPAGPGNEASTVEALTSIENVIGTTGDNVLIGDANDNVLIGHRGQDSFDGGDGTDTVDYSYSSSNTLEIDLAAGLATFVGSGLTETLTNIENAIGSDGNTVLLGDGGDNVLDGGNGDDTLNGRGGDDTFGGDDTLIGGNGDDVFVFTPGSGRNTVIDFTSGEDMIDLTAFVFEDFDDVSIFQVGDDAHLSLFSVGGPRVIFQDLDESELSPDDFLL